MLQPFISITLERLRKNGNVVADDQPSSITVDLPLTMGHDVAKSPYVMPRYLRHAFGDFV